MGIEANILSNRSLILLQSNCWVRLDEMQVDFVSKKFTDVAHTIPVVILNVRYQFISYRETTTKTSITYLIIVGLSRLNPNP